MLFSLVFYYIFFVFNQPKLLQNLITIPQKAVFRIRIILIRMIRGSASGMMDHPYLGPVLDPDPEELIFFGTRIQINVS